MRPRDPRPPSPSRPPPPRSFPLPSRAPVAALALLPFGFLGCSDSGTDVYEAATISAEMTGDREASFRGDAAATGQDGSFLVRGTGMELFEGHEMEFAATGEGGLEAGTYSVGDEPDEEDEGDAPDVVVTWLMEIALFTSTDGTLTVEETGDGGLAGTFSLTAIRTHVCQDDGFCTEVFDEEPEEGQVEGSFEVTGTGS